MGDAIVEAGLEWLGEAGGWPGGAAVLLPRLMADVMLEWLSDGFGLGEEER